MKPLIGITSNYILDDKPGLDTQVGVVGQSWQMLADNYIEAIKNAGGIPVIIPIHDSLETNIELIDKLDGVLMSGGNDLDPGFYGEFVTKEVGILSPKRDTVEIEMIKYIIEKTNKPLLGICRGLQVLNVACGGTLYQDLKKSNLNDHSITSSPLNHPIHKIEIKEESVLLKSIFDKKIIGVNSYHHQAVKGVGKDLIVTAESEDGIIEALEFNGEQFILGLQWHPEMMFDSKIQQRVFEKFVSECE